MTDSLARNAVDTKTALYAALGAEAPTAPLTLAVEVEHFIVDEQLDAIPASDGHGAAWAAAQPALQALAAGARAHADDAGHLVLQAGPFEDVGEIRYECEDFMRALGQLLGPHGLRALATGYVPGAGNAATRIRMEFASERDAQRAHRLARAGAPLFALLCDNAAGSPERPARTVHFAGDTTVVLDCADTMPAPFVTAYAALAKGLFAYETSLAALEELFEGATPEDVALAQADIDARGYEASAYGQTAAELADRMIDLAQSALASNERNYVSPLAQLVRTRRTLAAMGSRSR